jgi:hypothetical protein
LAIEAERQEVSIREVARRCKRDAKTFWRTLEAERPQMVSVEQFADALGYGRAIARALVGRPTDRDVEDAKPRMIGEVSIRNTHLFANATAAGEALRSALRAAPKDVVLRTVAAYTIAECGLDDSRVDPVLGPTLGAIEREMAPHFSLRPFIANESAIRDRKREGLSWLMLMTDALGLSSDDEAAIGRIVAPYIGDLGMTSDEMVQDLELQGVARDAYRDARAQSLKPKTGGNE